MLPLYSGSGVKVVVTSDDVDPEPASGRVSVVTVPSGRLLRKHNPLSDLQTLYHHSYKQHPICWGPDTLQNGFNLLVMSVSVIGSGVSLGLSTIHHHAQASSVDADTTRVKHQLDLRSQQTLSLQKYLENYDEEMTAYKTLCSRTL